MGSHVGTTLIIGKNSHSTSHGVRNNSPENTIVIGRRNFSDGQIEYTKPASHSNKFKKDSILRDPNIDSNVEASKKLSEQIQLTVWFHEPRTLQRML